MAARKKYKPRGKLGTGSRFKALKKSLASRRGRTRTGRSRKVKNPGALAAWIGARKLGRKRLTKLAARGRSRAARKRKRA